MSFNPLGIVAGQAVGTGVGGGISSVIEPILRDLVNEAWEKYQSMPLGVVLAANVVASGERSYAWGLGEAHKSGVNDDRFQALVDFNDTAPDLARLYELLHRGKITPGEFNEGAKKQLIEEKWLAPLLALAERILSPAEAANAWQQGFMSETEASDEAELSGVTPNRSAIQRELAGLPPGAMDGLTLLRRTLVDENTYRQIVREGHTKTKYTDALLGLREHIIPGREAAGLWLRGWLTEGEAKARGSLDGWAPEEMELLYQNRGRPATVRQAHIGFARGGRLPGFGDDEKATLKRSVEQSNIRTEWFDILYSQRFTYPSAFVLRALTQDGTFSGPETEKILVESGWKPEWATAAAGKWSGAGAGPSTKWADRARSRLFTVAHNEYLDESIDEATARAMLAQVGATAGEQDAIITLWNAERGIARLELTPSQIKKAYKKGPPEGFTFEEALVLLDARGMIPDDADTFLTT